MISSSLRNKKKPRPNLKIRSKEVKKIRDNFIYEVVIHPFKQTDIGTYGGGSSSRKEIDLHNMLSEALNTFTKVTNSRYKLNTVETVYHKRSSILFERKEDLLMFVLIAKPLAHRCYRLIESGT